MNRAELETTARIDRDELRGLLDAMTESPPPRRRARSLSEIAALLQPAVPVRFPRRATQPPLIGRGSSSTLTRAEQKAAQTVADARAKLDSADDRAEFPVLSHQIVANLSGEEISMLPMEIRLRLPEVPAWETPPTIELMPGTDRITSYSRPPREIAVETPMRRQATVKLIALLAAAFLVGLLGAYVLQ